MSEAPDFRDWAARITRKADKEADTSEAQRLMSIADYWVKLADVEDWQRDNAEVRDLEVRDNIEVNEPAH